MDREEKMKIVINNYFKKECSVNTSIREAFEKGFRIGASKVQKKHGKWIEREAEEWYGYQGECPFCHHVTIDTGKFCTECGASLECGDEQS